MSSRELLYLVGGLIVGFGAGYALDGFLERPLGKKALSVKDRMKLQPLKSQNIQLILLVVALAINGVVGITLIQTRTETTAVVECFSDYNQLFAEAYNKRAEASQNTSLAMDKIVESVSSKDQQAIEEAVVAYLDVRKTQTVSQKDNPYPAFPKTYCGQEEKQ